MEAPKVCRVQARVNGLAHRRSQRQEDHRVEYVRQLAHQKEPGKSVLSGGLSRNTSADGLARPPRCGRQNSPPLPTRTYFRYCSLLTCSIQLTTLPSLFS